MDNLISNSDEKCIQEIKNANDNRKSTKILKDTSESAINSNDEDNYSNKEDVHNKEVSNNKEKVSTNVQNNDIIFYENLSDDEIIEENENLSDNKNMSNVNEYPDFEKLDNECLLKTINYLSERKPPFQSFREMLKNDFIPKFVMQILSISSIENVHLTKNNDDDKLYRSNIENIYSVINYLRKIEKKYQIYIFDFYSESERISSTRLFFSTFLNVFFVKNQKNEMIERLRRFDKILRTLHDEHEQLIELFKILKKFSNNYVRSDIESSYDSYLYLIDKLNVPNIFNIVHWRIVKNNKVYPDSFFYLLQILYDKFDKKNHIIDIFCICFYKLKKINVPNSDILLYKCKTRVAYTNDKFCNLYDNSNLINQKANEITTSTIIENYRKKSPKMKIKQNKENILDSYEFWYQENDCLIEKDGIYINKYETLKFEFDFKKSWQFSVNLAKELKYVNCYDENSYEITKPKISTPTKLYKIFYYNEKSHEWKFDSDAFEEMAAEKNINIDIINVPIVFFVNSNEKEMIKITSNFTVGEYPKIEDDDDQIFVYSLCEQNLTNLDLKIDYQNKLKFGIKPLFLLLHVPEIKKNMKNLSIIVFQINLFLYLISDLAIVILDENLMQKQIRYVHHLACLSRFNDYNSICNKEILNSKLYQLNIHKDIKLIFLIKNLENEYNIELYKQINSNKDFMKLVENFEIKPVFHIIDIDKLITYEMFLKKITQILMNAKTTFADVKHNFNCCSLNKISPLDVKIKFNENEDIMKIIEKRYFQLLTVENNPDKVASQLYQEIIDYTFNLVVDFYSVIQEKILSLKKNSLQENKEFLITELKQNAELNIIRIKNLIKNKNLISINQMEKINRNHHNFLQKMFLEIIKSNFDNSLAASIYEYNQDIIGSQFEEDKKKIKHIFNDLLERIEKQKQVVLIDANENAKKQTNYVLKEVENTREIKVSVSVNESLTTVIEQDF